MPLGFAIAKADPAHSSSMSKDYSQFDQRIWEISMSLVGVPRDAWRNHFQGAGDDFLCALRG